MSLESSPENTPSESIAERREKLKEGFGVALCARQKDGGTASLEEQIILAEEMDLSAVQFDFRHRTIEEVVSVKEGLLRYRESHPEIGISIHGETPKIDEATLGFANMDRTLVELDALQDFSGESYTVHPPSINSRLFAQLPEEVRERVLGNYAGMFAGAASRAFENGKRFSFAIENMPVKGEGGSWGQSVEDVMGLVKRVEQMIVDGGIDSEIARQYVGVTLDINHALHGAEQKDYESILHSWFEGLGDYLKVVHLYTPSESGREFEEKYRISLELASRFNPNARIFMESKQGPETTKNLYDSLGQVE